MKRFVSWTVYVACFLLLVSCAPAAQPAPRPRPQPTPRVDVRSIPSPVPNAQSTNPDRNLPQLADGPESTERDPHPVSLSMLRQKYPQFMTFSGPSTSKMIALTWDDGPDRRFTPQILDVLKKHNVKGTFFVVGARAAAIPEMIKRMHDEGHVIGNHSYWHPNFGKKGVASMEWEINETDKVIEKITGSRTVLVRPPYGNITEDEVKQLGPMHKHMIGWNVDSLDWRQLPADEVERNVLSNVKPGSIILMHCAGNWNQSLQGGVDALDHIITKLQNDGMKFVTVPEMLKQLQR